MPHGKPSRACGGKKAGQGGLTLVVGKGGAKKETNKKKGIAPGKVVSSFKYIET